MRAHLVQLDIAWEDRPASRRRASDLLAAAEIQPGDLIVLPEMFETGFSLNIERTADADDTGARWLAHLARSTRATVLGGITAVGHDGRGRNRALAFSPAGEELARYDKVHPFSFGRESEYFTGGDRVVVFPWRTGDDAATICPAVCYDLRFPELFRAGRSLGAEVFAVMANWPAERADHWRALLIARAIENQSFVLGVNRAGADPRLKYVGGSIAVSPRGELLADAGTDQRVLSVEIDAGLYREWRKQFPAWADARPGLLPRLNSEGRFS